MIELAPLDAPQGYLPGGACELRLSPAVVVPLPKSRYLHGALCAVLRHSHGDACPWSLAPYRGGWAVTWHEAAVAALALAVRLAPGGKPFGLKPAVGYHPEMPAPGIPALKLALMKETGDLHWQRLVRDALDAAGSVTAAARLLGIGKGTLQRWITETPDLVVGITLPTGPGNPAFTKTHTKTHRGSTKKP